jgi:hypothetical protein
MFGTDEPRLPMLSSGLQVWAEGVLRAIDTGRLRANVEALPAPRNRLHAPEAMRDADELLMQGFGEAGWATEYRPYEVRNAVGFLDYAKDKYAAGTKLALYQHLAGANVLGIKEGSSPADTIIVGAHHDTIRDSPGADDNTASVCALLELARVLAPYKFRDTIILAAFDMEEIGFFGSQTLVKELARERRIRHAIVYETMAYTDTAPGSQAMIKGVGLFYPQQVGKMKQRQFAGDWTLVIYRNSAAAVARAFGAGLAHLAGAHVPILMRDPVDLAVVGKVLRYALPVVNNFGRSDNHSFWAAGIPAIMITDTADFRNPNYHRPTDTPDTLNYDRLAEIVGATAVAIAQLAGLVGPDEGQAKAL